MVVYDTDSGTRMKISHRLYEMMSQFKQPRALLEVMDEPLLQGLQGTLDQLLDAGFLLDTSGRRLPLRKPETRLATVFPTMFRTPFRTPGQPPSDIAIVGVPYDGGNIVHPGTRHAPRELRKRSCIDQEYRVDFATRKPMGWFEVANLKRLLEGVTIADLGDLRFTYGEAPEVIFDRLGSVCTEIVREGFFPAFIGGDHSISYPIVEALQRDREIQVVWFDAHTDYGELFPGICHNHKNVVRRIFTLPNVKRVINVGHRGYTSSDKVNRRPEKFFMVHAAQARHEGEYPLLQAMHPDLPCYISIDIDVLDPIYAPGTSTPVPGGLTPEELKLLLRVVGESHQVLGCDLTEVNPSLDSSLLTLIQAYQVFTVCLAASVHERADAKTFAASKVGV
jgi:agmatinase